jgi:hypothetical protein
MRWLTNPVSHRHAFGTAIYANYTKVYKLKKATRGNKDVHKVNKAVLYTSHIPLKKVNIAYKCRQNF